MTCEYRIVATTLRLPFQIRGHLEREGRMGWRLAGISQDLMILQRCGRHPFQIRMVQIAAAVPRMILETVESLALEGWEVSGLGDSFLYLHREESVCRIPRLDYICERLSIYSASQIQKFAGELGSQGYRLCGITAGMVLFARYPAESGPVEHRLDSIALKTPHGLAFHLKREAEGGWGVGDLSGVHLVMIQNPSG